MSYPLRIQSLNTGRTPERIAFAYSTKDRTELSVRSLEPLRATEGMDLFWMDGSTSEAGRAFPAEKASEIPNLREIHHGVTGGPDLAIVYSLTYLLAQGYPYLGLIENDVLVEPGWLQRILGLFEQGAQDGLLVGAVSARTFCERVLVPRRDYAVMFNHGAGMVLFTRDAARAVLNRYRTSTREEIRAIVRSRTGIDLAGIFCGTTADWYFDAGLLLDGYCSLAPIPSLANNIDADLAHWGLTLFSSPILVPERPGAFELFRHLHRMTFEPISEKIAYHPSLGRLVPVHQLIAAIPDSVSEGWAVTWRQGFGPFALEAKSLGATITLSVFASPVAFLMEAGPQGGEVAVRMANEEMRLSLLRDHPQIVCINCSGQSSTVQLEVLAPKIVFYGIQLQEASFSFPSARSFDFAVLRPCVGL